MSIVKRLIRALLIAAAIGGPFVPALMQPLPDGRAMAQPLPLLDRLAQASPATATGPTNRAPSAEARSQQRPEPAARTGVLALLPDNVVSEHAITIGGQELRYRAEAGTIMLRDPKGETSAAIFFTAYTREPGGAGRPITFAVNGGPGAASAYLHIGGLGPRIAEFGPNGEALPPPARLRDNPDTWLDFTDLVFVDPVGTGWSRSADGSDEKFWSVTADTEALAAFIRLYLQRENRLLSPVFLAGESYGGFRAVSLSRKLQGDLGIGVSGAVLISPALEMALLYGESYDPLTWALPLPSMAATKLAREGVKGRAAFAQRLAEAERFALSDYVVGLMAGRRSGDALAERVAGLIGLPVDIVRDQDGRVPTSVFIKEFDRANTRLLSRYDALIGAPDPDPSSSRARGPDPVLDGIRATLSAGFVTYARDELGFRTDITFRLLDGDISRRWDWGTRGGRQGYAGVLDELQQARAANASLQVLIASGYTDLVTPYFATHYLVGQLPPLRGAPPIAVEDYEGGHMMYLRADSRKALKADVAALYGRALAAATRAP